MIVGAGQGRVTRQGRMAASAEVRAGQGEEEEEEELSPLQTSAIVTSRRISQELIQVLVNSDSSSKQM